MALKQKADEKINIWLSWIERTLAGNEHASEAALLVGMNSFTECVRSKNSRSSGVMVIFAPDCRNKRWIWCRRGSIVWISWDKRLDSWCHTAASPEEDLGLWLVYNLSNCDCNLPLVPDEVKIGCLQEPPNLFHSRCQHQSRPENQLYPQYQNIDWMHNLKGQ